jgi:hypothetical protein
VPRTRRSAGANVIKCESLLLLTLRAGIDIMIFLVNGEKLVFLVKTKINYANIWSLHWLLRKPPIFSAKNWGKSPKIVIITSTPGARQPHRC